MEKYKIGVEADTTKAVKSMDDLGDSIEEASEETLTFQQRIGELEEQLIEMAGSGQRGTKEFREMSKELGSMRALVNDVNMDLDALSMTTTQSLGLGIQGVAGGFEALQGAMGTLGVETEFLESSLLKVQSAMALSGGIQSVREAMPVFDNFGTKAINAFKGMTKASKAFMATGLGLIISGIALAVANWDKLSEAIGFNNEALSDSIKNRETLMQVETQALETSAQELSDLDQLQVKLRNNTISRKEKNEAIRGMQEQYPDLLYNMDIENMTLEDLQVSIDKYIKLANLKAKVEASQALRTEEYKKQLEEQVKAQNRDNVSLTEKMKLIYENNSLTDLFTGKVINKNNVDKLANDLQKKANQNLKESNKESQKTIDFLDQEIFKTQEQIGNLESELGLDKKKRQSTIETRGAQEKAEQDRLKALEDMYALEEEIRRANLNAEEQELASLGDKYDQMIARANGNKELELAVIEEQEKESQAIRDKYQAERDAIDKANEEKRRDFMRTVQANNIELMEEGIEKDIEAINMKYEVERQAILDNEKLTEDQKQELLTQSTDLQEKAISEIRDKYREEDAEKEKILNETKVEMAQNALGAMSGLVEAFAGESEEAQRRAFNINKAISIGQAIISTAQGIMAQLAVPQDALTGQNFIKAGIVATTGVAQIATILKTKFQASGEGGASGSSISAPTATGGNVVSPEFNIVGDSGINQLAELQGQPVQAYVVSGNVTTAQSLDRNRIENGTI